MLRSSEGGPVGAWICVSLLVQEAGGELLLRLDDKLHGIRGQGVADSLRLVADHHQRPFHAQAPAQIQDVPHHGRAA
jgi:hypothetical protein